MCLFIIMILVGLYEVARNYVVRSLLFYDKILRIRAKNVKKNECMQFSVAIHCYF